MVLWLLGFLMLHLLFQNWIKNLFGRTPGIFICPCIKSLSDISILKYLIFFCSDFHEIFDVDWFISFLSNDVKIVRQLPKKGGKIIRMRVPRKCTPKCYQTRVLPVLIKKHVCGSFLILDLSYFR